MVDTLTIYQKTELGLREIRERSLNLPVPMRGLLIMVDGNRTAADLLDKAKVLRLDASALEALEVGGLIAQRFPPAGAEPVARSEADVKRFLAAQHSISDAINEHLGFRGYGLMMKLQKTEGIRDLHDLLRDVATALVKRLGVERATPIVSSLEGLLANK